MNHLFSRMKTITLDKSTYFLSKIWLFEKLMPLPHLVIFLRENFIESSSNVVFQCNISFNQEVWRHCPQKIQNYQPNLYAMKSIYTDNTCGNIIINPNLSPLVSYRMQNHQIKACLHRQTLLSHKSQSRRCNHPWTICRYNSMVLAEEKRYQIRSGIHRN